MENLLKVLQSLAKKAKTTPLATFTSQGALTVEVNPKLKLYQTPDTRYTIPINAPQKPSAGLSKQSPTRNTSLGPNSMDPPRNWLVPWALIEFFGV